MEELNLKNCNEDINKLFEDKILNNENIPEDIKNQWRKILFENNSLKNLNITDINNILDRFNLLTQITLIFLINNSEEYFILECAKINLELDLYRAFNPEKPQKSFILKIFGVK